jgi:hypothetical protein
MLTIPHMLVGAATATIVTNATGSPALGFAAAVGSHFLMDMVPHLDVPPSAPRYPGTDEIIYTPRIYLQVAIDNGVALLGLAYLWTTHFGYPSITPFLFGALGGFLPDLIFNVPFWKNFFRRLPVLNAIQHFHDWTHHIWHDRFPMTRYAWLGVLTQLVAIGLSVWYLF